MIRNVDEWSSLVVCFCWLVGFYSMSTLEGLFNDEVNFFSSN